MTSLNKVLDNILKYPHTYKAVFEHRPHHAMFGTRNYGDIRSPREIKDMINPADNDPWDVFAPGYSFKLRYNTRYKIKTVIGVLLLSNGNHKLAVRVNVPGFEKDRALEEIKLYCDTYRKKVKKRGVWVAFDEQYCFK